MKFDFTEQVVNKTDQELIQIFTNPQDYQADFVKVVTEELNKRGINEEKYQQEKDQRERIKKEQLEKGRPGDPVYMTVGFISAGLGGLIGIIAGIVYSQSKIKGTSHYVYNEETRKKGILMMFIGIFVFLILSIWKFS